MEVYGNVRPEGKNKIHLFPLNPSELDSDCRKLAERLSARRVTHTSGYEFFAETYCAEDRRGTTFYAARGHKLDGSKHLIIVQRKVVLLGKIQPSWLIRQHLLGRDEVQEFSLRKISEIEEQMQNREKKTRASYVINQNEKRINSRERIKRKQSIQRYASIAKNRQTSEDQRVILTLLTQLQN